MINRNRMVSEIIKNVVVVGAGSFLGESITPMLLIASIVMFAGCCFAAK